MTLPRWLLLAAALGFPARNATAAAWTETFTRDPASEGWVSRGDPTLFTWDSTRGRISATWDSTRTNTFLHRPLGTVLTRNDSFRFAFTLQLDEIRTTSPDSTFQIALGLVRAGSAFRTNFFRGSGIQPATGPTDVVEFNYFPASRTITPTAAAVAIGTNNLRWTMVNLFPLEFTPGSVLDIAVRFDAPSQTLHLDLRRDGEPWASGQSRLDTRFTDFRLDTLALTSYSGAGQPSGYGGDVFARGWIDDLAVEFPDPPAAALALQARPDGILLSAPVVPGWIPALEATQTPGGWLPLDLPPVTEGDSWRFQDPSPSPPARLYRLRLDRP